MIEKALKGGLGYWIWLCAIFALIITGFVSYLRQINEGLTVTGMGRDISWGLYIANFTFLVGVAASAVIVVLPYYLHNYKKFAKLTILGEFLAVSAIIMTILFITVDLGTPSRILNVLFYPTPTSLLFWDMVVLSGYLILNIIIGWVTLDAKYKEIEPPGWVKVLAYISIPWAISIHTVTAFIYSGLIAKPFWHTSLLAPRFLASAFASGPALLVVLCIILKHLWSFNVEKEAIKRLSVIITYALAVHIFFFIVEVYTVYYADDPFHKKHFEFLFLGTQEKRFLLPWAWGSLILSIAGFIMLLFSNRKNDAYMVFTCILVTVSIWAEKGISLIVGGFIPTSFEEYPVYHPTTLEILITLGVYGVGALILTILYKTVVSVENHK